MHCHRTAYTLIYRAVGSPIEGEPAKKMGFVIQICGIIRTPLPTHTPTESNALPPWVRNAIRNAYMLIREG
jgi:hypothetical protein